MKPINKGPFLGINNRKPSNALHVDKVGDFLADAVNVDINGAGEIVRRQCATLYQAMTDPHSLHGDLLVRGSVLYGITLPTYSETLLKVLASDNRMSYVDYAGSTYYSNGVDSGRVENGAVYPMALPAPDAPSLSAVAGTLHSGRYRVALSYANAATGEEGALSDLTGIDTSTGIRVALPGAVTGATHVNVYATTVNGSVLFLQASVAFGPSSADIVSIATGRDAVQRDEEPLPPGQLMLHNGALCSFSGPNLYRGIPYRPGYCLSAKSRVTFPADISNVVSAQNGVFVVADKTYWLAGTDISDVQMIQDVLPYGGVAGTAFESPDKSLVGWFGKNGIVLGTPAGEVEAVMSDNIDLTAPDSGVSMVFETRGYRRVVSCGWCLNLESKAATRYEGWDFTSSSGEYATASDGIYLLHGTGKVDASASFGKNDFGTEAEKGLPAAYVGASSEYPLVLTVGTPSGESYDYEARSYSDSLDIHRFDPGRGLKANWFDLSISNVDGSDFTIASVSFALTASQRRI